MTDAEHLREANHQVGALRAALDAVAQDLYAMACCDSLNQPLSQRLEKLARELQQAADRAQIAARHNTFYIRAKTNVAPHDYPEHLTREGVHA